MPVADDLINVAISAILARSSVRYPINREGQTHEVCLDIGTFIKENHQELSSGEPGRYGLTFFQALFLRKPLNDLCSTGLFMEYFDKATEGVDKELLDRYLREAFSRKNQRIEPAALEESGKLVCMCSRQPVSFSNAVFLVRKDPGGFSVTLVSEPVFVSVIPNSLAALSFRFPSMLSDDFIVRLISLPEELQKQVIDRTSEAAGLLKDWLKKGEIDSFKIPYHEYLEHEYRPLADILAPMLKDGNYAAVVDWEKIYKVLGKKFFTVELSHPDKQDETISFIELALLKDPCWPEHLEAFIKNHPDEELEVYNVLLNFSPYILEKAFDHVKAHIKAMSPSSLRENLEAKRNTMFFELRAKIHVLEFPNKPQLLACMSKLGYANGREIHVSFLHGLARDLSGRQLLMRVLEERSEWLSDSGNRKLLSAVPPATEESLEKTEVWYELAMDPQTSGRLMRLLDQHPSLLYDYTVTAGLGALRPASAGLYASMSALYWFSIYCPTSLMQILSNHPPLLLRDPSIKAAFSALRPANTGPFENTSIWYELAYNRSTSQLLLDFLKQHLCLLDDPEVMKAFSALRCSSYSDSDPFLLDFLKFDAPEVMKVFTLKNTTVWYWLVTRCCESPSLIELLKLRPKLLEIPQLKSALDALHVDVSGILSESSELFFPQEGLQWGRSATFFSSSNTVDSLGIASQDCSPPHQLN